MKQLFTHIASGKLSLTVAHLRGSAAGLAPAVDPSSAAQQQRFLAAFLVLIFLFQTGCHYVALAMLEVTR